MDTDPRDDRRARKRHKRRRGMQVSNRNIKTVIAPLIKRKADEEKAKKTCT